jgi:hemoglobin-like flavoprotein
MENGNTNTALSNGIWTRGDVTAYSDARVKDNIEVIENAVEKIKAIRGVTFTRNDREDTTKRFAGVIAQEVLEVLPEVVTEDALGTYSVAYGNLNALLIEAIKEQQKEIDELKSLINGLTK